MQMPFHFVNGFLHCAKLLSLIRSHLLIFLFPLPEETDSKKLLLRRCQSVLPMLSSRSFVISGVTFRGSNN